MCVAFSINRRIIHNAIVQSSYHFHIFSRIRFTLTDRNNSSSTIFRELEKELPVCSFIFSTVFTATRCNVRWTRVVRGNGGAEPCNKKSLKAIFVPGEGHKSGNDRFAIRSSIRLIFYLGEEAYAFRARGFSARDVACMHPTKQTY